jgi:hypothetical protein
MAEEKWRDFKVQDIFVHERDAVGEKVQTVYSKNPPLYAVYLSESRVSIEFADDPAKQMDQRAALVKTYALRSEINGLLDDWRKNNNKRVNGYERMQAAALISGLEGDLDGAESVLQKIKENILSDRASLARLVYMRTATGACLFVILFAFVFSRPWLWDGLLSFHDPYLRYVWLAVAAGAIGSFFSIATAISKRDVPIGLRTIDNIVDALIRVCVGGISGAILVALLHAQLVSFALLGQAFSIDGKFDWEMIMLAAIVAGFSERLVPDLLAKAEIKNVQEKKQGNNGAGNQSSPRQPPKDSNAPRDEVQSTDNEGVAPDSEEEMDCCVGGLGKTAEEEIPDSELPPATGGVAGN